MSGRVRQCWFARAILVLSLFGAAGAEGASVTIEARSAPYVFAPSTRTIHVGDTVVWTIRKDGDAHTITSGRIVGGADGKFDSGLKDPGSSYAHKFTAAGTYPYYCEIHADSGMKGTITVVAATRTPPPTSRPTPRPTPRPTVTPTPAPTLSPNPTEAVIASPTPLRTSASAAPASPVSAASFPTQPVASASPDANDATPASDAGVLLAAGILVALALVAATVWLARRKP